MQQGILETWSYLSFSWINQYLRNKDEIERNTETVKMSYFMKDNEYKLIGDEEILDFNNFDDEETLRFTLKKGFFRKYVKEFIKCLIIKIISIFLLLKLNSDLGKFIKSKCSYNLLYFGFKLIFISILRINLDVHSNFLVSKLSLEIQSSMTRTIFKNIIKGKSIKKDSKISPNVYNLLFGDFNIIETFVLAIIELIISPIRILGAWSLLRGQFGFSANLALITYIVIWISSLILQTIGSLKKKQFMNLRDIRISKCHEYLTNLINVRQLFWDDVIYRDLIHYRDKELNANLKRFLFLMSGTFLEYNAHSFSQYILFCTYIYYYYYSKKRVDNILMTVSSGLTTLHALNILTSPTRNIISNIIEGLISFIRFKGFLEDNSDCFDISIKPINKKKLYFNEINKFIKIKKSTFTWKTLETLRKSENDYLLDFDINRRNFILNIRSFQCYTNELCIITGESGSGKSSLINCILGNMIQTSGISINSLRDFDNIRVCYSSQNIWIPKGTIRSTILFGQEYEESKYNLIIKSCSLDLDFNKWKEGDMRIIDECDNTLSNGQKSRISLARALYLLECLKSDKSKYYKTFLILDDNFSSIDINVSKQIFRNLFTNENFLYGSFNILTCHSNIIPHLLCDNNFKLNIPVRIIVMNSGSIIYNDLANNYLSSLHSNEKIKFLYNPVPKIEEPILMNSDKITSIQQYDNDNENDNYNQFDNNFNISFRTYVFYINNIGTFFFGIFILACITKIGITKSVDFYLTQLLSNISDKLSEQSKYKVSPKSFILYFTMIFVLKLIIESFTFISEAIMSSKASKIIHRNYLISIINAPLSFYSFNPISKILNRFNLDLLILDDLLIRKIVGIMIRFFEPLLQIILISYTNPFLSPIIILHLYYIFKNFGFTLQNNYKLIQKIILDQSSILTNIFSEIQNGYDIIVEFNNESIYLNKFNQVFVELMNFKYLQFSLIQWASLRIQLFSGPLAIFFYCCFAAIMIFNNGYKDNNIGLEVGYTLYYFITFTDKLSVLFIKFAGLERDMCSIERVQEYSRISTMQDLSELVQIKKIYEINNLKTNIVFQNVELSYFVSDFSNNKKKYLYSPIRNFNLEIKDKEHIGIIGRTGNGKSTLAKAILGIIKPSKGRILFNGIDINKIPEKYKSQIFGVIPQQQIKFKDWSIRKYLDPFSLYSDKEILNALKLSGIVYLIDHPNLEKNLDSIFLLDSNFNSIFTEFQLKYLNFTRLLLNKRKYKVIILDEPTSVSVDLEYINNSKIKNTNKLVPIEDLINKYFRDCCVIVISHNPFILKYCDRIVNIMDRIKN